MDKSKFSKCALCDVMGTGIDFDEDLYKFYDNESFIAKIDKGSMVEGYVLLASKRHINSMGELTDKEYTDFLDAQNVIRNGLEKIYKKNIVCFEHGSGKYNQENAASSIKHAHFHMVAIDRFNDKLNEKILSEMKMSILPNQRDLKKIC